MAATDSESDTKSVNKTTYAPLPAAQRHEAFLLDENAQTDELLEALQFLRSKVKDLTSQPPSPRKEEETQTDHTITTASGNSATSPTSYQLQQNVDVQSYHGAYSKPILSKTNSSEENSRQNSARKVVRISDNDASSSRASSALPTPRKLSPDITEQIRNRISTILRPPDYDMRTYDKITSIDPTARIFLDDSIRDHQSQQALSLQKTTTALNDKSRTGATSSASSQTRTPRGLNQEIEAQLKSADMRCEALEKQLEQMRHIVKKTTEQNSTEIEKIIEESRKEASKFDILQVEATQAQLYKSTKKALLTDEDFVEKVMSRLKKEKLSRKKLAKISQKLAEYGADSEDVVRQLRNVSGDGDNVRAGSGRVRSSTKLNPVADKERVQSGRARSKARVSALAKSAPTARSYSASRVKEVQPTLSKSTPGFAMDTKQSRDRRMEAQQRRFDKSKHPTHYYIKLADIPFVAGKNAGKSHHTGANIQQLLHDLKTSRSLIKSSKSSTSLAHKNVRRDTTTSQLPLPPGYSKKDLYRNVQNLRDEIKGTK